ncbi:Arm DNA-binding domain-containing protein [Pseudomonas aeruginosa]|uniref:Arm DNA-binding domain-containing protein n=1 Tax=Pseudomonas aeruginosa TaxID=287 RepID=UPI002A91F0C1|nr:Arm DNA-binding domain-containing protein [Pseudomonas aeruginosa]
MKTKITSRTLSTLTAKDKPYRIHDTAQPGLSIRVLPSGHASYMVSWGRNQAATLGRVGVMTLEQARREAAQYLAEAHEHGAPPGSDSGPAVRKLPNPPRLH